MQSQQVLENDFTEHFDSEKTLRTLRVTEHFAMRLLLVILLIADVPEIRVSPGNTVSFQCILLSSLTSKSCSQRRSEMRLTWLDLSDQKIRDNSSHWIARKSPCDVTLSVTLQAPGTRAFKCQASAGTSTQNSAVMRVQVPAVKGRRGSFDMGVQPQNEKRDFAIEKRHFGIVVAVVLMCAALTALVTMFVVIKRRKRAHQANASGSVVNNQELADDVIYMDVDHSGSPERVPFPQGGDTEYACIRYQ
ncbi:diverse immunoglobulin domain-containing protein 3.1 [Stigmatopora argus]